MNRGLAPSAISTPLRPTKPRREASLAGPGPCPLPLPSGSISRSARGGWSPPHPPTYRAGAPAPWVREKGIARTHFWELWPLLPGAGQRILWGGRKEGSGEDRAPRRSSGRRRSAEARGPGDPRRELVDAAAAGTPQASPQARRFASPAAAFAVSASTAADHWPAGGGELRVARRRAGARLQLCPTLGAPQPRREPGSSAALLCGLGCNRGILAARATSELAGWAPCHPRLLQPPLFQHSRNPGAATPPRRERARAASEGLGPL